MRAATSTTTAPHRSGSRWSIPSIRRRAIGVVELDPEDALCGSATNRRAWGDGLHHVLDGRTGRPTNDIVATWVVVPQSCMRGRRSGDGPVPCRTGPAHATFQLRVRTYARRRPGRVVAGVPRRGVRMIATVRDLLDRQLGRVTMYRLVTIVLSVLAAIYITYSATGVIDGVSAGHEVLSLVVLSRRVVRVQPALRSALADQAARRVVDHHRAAAVLPVRADVHHRPVADYLGSRRRRCSPTLSKYVLAWRGRHVFNPAAAGAFLVYIAQQIVGPRVRDVRDLAGSGNRQDAAVRGWSERSSCCGARAASMSGLLFIALAAVLIVLGLNDRGTGSRRRPASRRSSPIPSCSSPGSC